MGVVGVGVILVAFLTLKLTQDHIGVAVLQIFGMSSVVRAGHDDDLVVSLVGLGVGSVAVDGLQVLVGILVVVSLGIDIHVVVHGLHGGLFLLAEGVTGSLGSIIKCVSIFGAVDGSIQEMVGPGGTGFLVVGLGAQGSRGIQNVGNPAAVLADVFVDGIDVEIVQLYAGNLVITNHQGGGPTGSQTGDGSLQGNTGHQSHTQGHDYPEGDGVSFQFLGFFCCSLLLLGYGGSVLLFTELLLAGCTHGNQFLSKYVLLVATPMV